MYVPERVCGVANWLHSVRTDTSMSGIGPGWTRGSDGERPVPREYSCELEQLSITISVVEDRIGGMPHISEE
jgi:hypothetical protein